MKYSTRWRKNFRFII